MKINDDYQQKENHQRVERKSTWGMQIVNDDHQKNENR